MAETLKDFLVSVGFVVDEASQRRAQQAVASHEKAVTTITDEAGQVRMDREALRQQLATKGNDLSKVRLVETEKKTAAAVVKVQKDSTDRIARIDADAHKKAAERRAVAIKEVQKAAVQLEPLMARIGVIAGGLGAAFAGTGLFQNIMGTAVTYAGRQQQASRTGSSIKGIQSLLYGFSQLGVDRSEANSSFEGFRDYLVRNPGIKDLLRKAGVDADADPATAFAQLGRYFSTMPYSVQLVRAGQMGISENALRALENPDLAGKIAEGDARNDTFGLDPDKAGKDAKEMTAAYDRLSTDLGAIKDRTEAQFFKPMAAGFNTISDWLEKHSDAADKFAQGMVAFSGLMAVRVVPTLVKLAGAITGISGALASVPAWVLAFLGADAAMHPLNKGEGDIRADGIHMPDGTVRPNSIFDPSREGIALPRTESRAGRMWRQRPKWLGGEGKGGARERLGQQAAAYEPGEFLKETGASAGEYKAMREGIATIEGARYNQMGGSSNKYAGRYQMGPNEITDTARALGETPPSREQFLNDPQMQERYFERYTLQHYRQLMKNPRFRALPLRERLAILGYAHNQGAGSSARNTGAAGYVNSGSVGRDAFGTAGTDYIDSIHKQLSKLDAMPKPPPALLRSPFGGLDSDAFKRMTSVAPLGPSPASMYAAYDNSRRGDTSFNQTVNVHGATDPQMTASAVKATAERGSKDFIRNLQGATQ